MAKTKTIEIDSLSKYIRHIISLMVFHIIVAKAMFIRQDNHLLLDRMSSDGILLNRIRL